MSEMLISAMHQKELHNHDDITETGVTATYDSKLLGMA